MILILAMMKMNMMITTVMKIKFDLIFNLCYNYIIEKKKKKGCVNMLLTKNLIENVEEK